MKAIYMYLVLLVFVTVGLMILHGSVRAYEEVKPIGPHCHRVHLDDSPSRMPYLCDRPNGDTVVVWRNVS